MNAPDWWAVGEVRHAFVAPSFRSLCGEARWTAAVRRDETAPACPGCLAAAEEGAVPTALFAVAPNPMDRKTKEAVYRRRWRERHDARTR